MLKNAPDTYSLFIQVFKAQPLMNLSYFRVSKDHAYFEKKNRNGNDQIYESFRVDKTHQNLTNIGIHELNKIHLKKYIKAVQNLEF